MLWTGPATVSSWPATVMLGAAFITASAKGLTISMLFTSPQVPGSSSVVGCPCRAQAALKSDSEITATEVSRTLPKSSMRISSGLATASAALMMGA